MDQKIVRNAGIFLVKYFGVNFLIMSYRPICKRLLLLYLFSDNLLASFYFPLSLINLLNGKAKVNSDFISKVAHDILAYYEVTTNELICMCFEQKLIVRNINYVTCFCKKRI